MTSFFTSFAISLMVFVLCKCRTSFSLCLLVDTIVIICQITFTKYNIKKENIAFAACCYHCYHVITIATIVTNIIVISNVKKYSASL